MPSTNIAARCRRLPRSPQLLREQWSAKDSKRKQDVVKKVIAYMTLGIDVSRLYPEMVKVS